MATDALAELLKNTVGLSLKLPPELKHIICLQLLPKDLKNLRLVDAPWGSVAASILFHTFESDLADTDTRKVDAILTSCTGGMLDSIKQLRIKAAKSGADIEQSRNLLRLIGVLPRNSLTGLHLDSCMDQDVLGVYLRAQSQLRYLKVFVATGRQAESPPSVSFIQGSLGKLEALFIGTQGEVVDGFASWMPHLTSLKMLRIAAKETIDTTYFKGWQMPGRIPMFQLRALCLERVSLPDSPEQIIDMIQLPQLEALVLRKCQNSVPLTKMLAHGFGKVTTQLRRLEHTSEKHEGQMYPICQLLNSVASLEEVSIDACQAQPLPVACLTHHGPSLRYLRLTFLHILEALPDQRHDVMYSPLALDILINACAELEFLGLSLATMNFGIWANLEPVHVSLLSRKPECQRLAKLLTIIARCTKLQTLCLTHSPYMAVTNQTIGVRERQWRHAQLASCILGFLGKHGSPVRFIAFQPPGYVGINGQRDSTGHSWPKYYYRKANLVYEDDMDRGTIGTTAIAVKKEEFKKLSPWHERLEYF